MISLIASHIAFVSRNYNDGGYYHATGRPLAVDIRGFDLK